LAGKTTAESFTQRWDKYLNPKAMHGARRHGVPMKQFTRMLAADIKYFHSRAHLLTSSSRFANGRASPRIQTRKEFQ
jgi:hypothetical protein